MILAYELLDRTFFVRGAREEALKAPFIRNSCFSACALTCARDLLVGTLVWRRAPCGGGGEGACFLCSSSEDALSTLLTFFS